MELGIFSCLVSFYDLKLYLRPTRFIYLFFEYVYLWHIYGTNLRNISGRMLNKLRI